MKMLFNTSRKLASRSVLKISSLLFLSLISCALVGGELAEPKRYDLLLAGGSLKTCSSMSTKNCRHSDFDSDDKHSILYQITPEAGERFRSIAKQNPENVDEFSKVYAALMKAYARETQIATTRSEFFEQLETLGLTQREIRALSDRVYFSLLDTHEYAQQNSLGLRKQERAEVLLSANEASIEIYQTFVDQATLRVTNSDKPRIAVVTASSRDAFESADFYLSALKSLGAEVVWLPIDSSYQYARWLEGEGVSGCASLASIRAKHNSFDRARVYPERTKLQRLYCEKPALLHDLLKNVQGVFFNGGDQSRTIAALRTPTGAESEELRIIRERMQQHHLIVGGTSAGTAVQAGGFATGRPVPMIANGTSKSAMSRGAFAYSAPSERCVGQCENALERDDLTFNPNGGTGLFSIGLLDTHFSERDREGRLIVLTSATEQQMAFGVDETTAMLVSVDEKQAYFRVVGENGVFVVDRASAQSQLIQSIEEGSLVRSYAAQSHYWTGDMRAIFDFDTQQWTFSSGAKPLTSRAHFNALQKGLWRDAVRVKCGSQTPIQYQQDNYTVIMQANESTQFFRQQTTGKRHCGYFALPFVITSGQ